MRFNLPCNGPYVTMLLMRAFRGLEWCEFCGVHDGEPVLAEGGAVCPSEVLHQLWGESRTWFLWNSLRSIPALAGSRLSIKHLSHPEADQQFLLSYLDTVPHVLLAGLLLHHLWRKFQSSAIHLVRKGVFVWKHQNLRSGKDRRPANNIQSKVACLCASV